MENNKLNVVDKVDLISFLKLNKGGKYIKVSKNSLPYLRIKEQTIMVEDEYYYSYI